MKRSHAVLAALVALAGLLTLETRADDRIISPATRVVTESAASATKMTSTSLT